MVRRTYINPPPSKITLPDNAPKDAVKVDFARRLQAAMVQKGWTQSELARRAQNYLPAGRKFGRDSVSLYIRGRTSPGPVFMDALCKALGKTRDQLLPTRGVPSAGEANPAMDARDLGDGTTWIRINQALSWPVALEILRLVNEGR